MRKFIVNVNGSSYEVEVEEVSSANANAAKPASAPAAGPRKSRRQRLRQGQMPGLRNRQNFFNNFCSCFYVFAVV